MFDLADVDLARVLLRDGLYQRRQRLAGLAPGREEVDEHRGARRTSIVLWKSASVSSAKLRHQKLSFLLRGIVRPCDTRHRSAKMPFGQRTRSRPGLRGAKIIGRAECHDSSGQGKPCLVIPPSKEASAGLREVRVAGLHSILQIVEGTRNWECASRMKLVALCMVQGRGILDLVRPAVRRRSRRRDPAVRQPLAGRHAGHRPAARHSRRQAARPRAVRWRQRAGEPRGLPGGGPGARRDSRPLSGW